MLERSLGKLEPLQDCPVNLSVGDASDGYFAMVCGVFGVFLLQ
jgi:hypothetical protein